MSDQEANDRAAAIFRQLREGQAGPKTRGRGLRRSRRRDEAEPEASPFSESPSGSPSESPSPSPSPPQSSPDAASSSPTGLGSPSAVEAQVDAEVGTAPALQPDLGTEGGVQVAERLVDDAQEPTATHQQTAGATDHTAERRIEPDGTGVGGASEGDPPPASDDAQAPPLDDQPVAADVQPTEADIQPADAADQSTVEVEAAERPCLEADQALETADPATETAGQAHETAELAPVSRGTLIPSGPERPKDPEVPPYDEVSRETPASPGLAVTETNGRTLAEHVSRGTTGLLPADETLPDLGKPMAEPQRADGTALHPSSALPLPRRMAVANQKGGVGKTTTAVNLGAALADLGYRVLLVDLDPQGNATTGLGISNRDLDQSIYDVILHDAPIRDVIANTDVDNLFVVPSTIDLAGAEVELVPLFSRELRLRKALDSLGDEYDYLLIDCPPSLGLLTVNGLAAATELIVPIQCEYYALEGLGQLLHNVSLVQANLNEHLSVSTIVLTMYDARTRLAEQVVDEVRRHFGSRVCRNIVPRTVRLSEAPSFGQPVTVFDPSSRGAIAYREIAKEVSGGTPQRAR